MMSKLLYVISSPRGEQSESRAIADEFLNAYVKSDPSVEVDTLDLWNEYLPVYGAKGVGAKMTVFAGQTPSGEEGEAWAAVQRVFARFDATDEYLFTVPMWNHPLAYGVPDHTRIMPKDLFAVLDPQYYNNLGAPGIDKADYREQLGSTYFQCVGYKESVEQLAMVLKAVK
jgi:hypothetical protein